MERNVVWCLPAMRFFGEMYAKALGWSLEVGGYIGQCDRVFVVGLYDVPDYETTIGAVSGAAKKHFHFCGTDVTYLEYPELLPEATFSADTQRLADELLTKGVECDFVLYGPTKFHVEVVPLPKRPKVAVYYGNNPLKYGSEIVEVLASAMPDVDFVGYSFGQLSDEQLVSLMQESTCTLRLVAHDGGAATVREFLEAGRYALATTPFEYAQSIQRDDVNSIIAKLREVFKNTEPNWEAAAYYHEENSEETFAARLLAEL